MNEFITTWNIPSKHGINASVNSSCAQPPPGLLWGICLPFQSWGWDAFANFVLPGGQAFTNPGAIPELFQDMHAVSYQHTQRILLKKSWLAHLSRTGGCNWLMHDFLKKKKNFRFHLKKQHLAIKKKEKQSTTVLKPSKFGIEKRKPGQNFALSPPWPTIIYHFRSVDLPWRQSARLPNSSRHHT